MLPVFSLTLTSRMRKGYKMKGGGKTNQRKIESLMEMRQKKKKVRGESKRAGKRRKKKGLKKKEKKPTS